MSADEKVAKDLVETLEDGRNGFASAADKLRDSERPEVAATLQRLSEQRAGFARDIVAMGHEYGDDVEESGSVAAALHRGWLSLKDALTGDDASGVLDAGVDGVITDRPDLLREVLIARGQWLPAGDEVPVRTPAAAP